MPSTTGTRLDRISIEVAAWDGLPHVGGKIRAPIQVCCAEWCRKIKPKFVDFVPMPFQLGFPEAKGHFDPNKSASLGFYLSAPFAAAPLYGYPKIKPKSTFDRKTGQTRCPWYSDGHDHKVGISDRRPFSGPRGIRLYGPRTTDFA